MSLRKPAAPKFKVGDRVVADGDLAIITGICPPADSDMFTERAGYAVEWIDSNECGTFEEEDLEEIK